MNPRLVLTSDSSATIWKESAIKSEYLPTLIEDFSAMVNDADGAAHEAQISGYNIAAKTGTEIKSATSGKVIKIKENDKYYKKAYPLVPEMTRLPSVFTPRPSLKEHTAVG